MEIKATEEECRKFAEEFSKKFSEKLSKSGESIWWRHEDRIRQMLYHYLMEAQKTFNKK